MNNFFPLFNQFWIENCGKLFQLRETALYYFLLDRYNRSFGQMPFVCSTDFILSQIPFSKHTFYDAREVLAERGLISFVEGKWGKKAPLYSILQLHFNGVSQRTSGETNERTTRHTKEINKTNINNGNNTEIIVPSSIIIPDNDNLQKYLKINGEWK